MLDLSPSIIYSIRSSLVIAFQFLYIFCFCQNRSFGTLPLIKSDTFIQGSVENLNHTEDYKQILNVYEKLVNARGDFRYVVPKLFLKDEVANVAYIDYDANEITFELKAYNVAKKYGDKAIAFLLGHELTHYYEKHAWKSAFAKSNTDLKIGKDLNEIQDKVAYETEADYLGGFLAYTAGFGFYKDIGNIIGELYKAYDFDPELNDYPALNDRIELSKRSVKKIESLVDVFDAANLLMAIGKDEAAYKYYEYILRDFQSRELYNNIGVLATRNAMALMDKDSLKFKFVSALDINFQGSKDVSKPVNEQIEEGLNQAILHFNAAINLDPNYAPAYLNKANAYALKKDYTKALFYLNEEAVPIAKKDTIKYAKTLTDALVLKGIIAAKTGNEDLATDKFTEAKNKGNNLGDVNLAILRKVGRSVQPVVSQQDFFTENIGVHSLQLQFQKRKIDPGKKPIKISKMLTLFQNTPADSLSKVFICQSDDPKIRTNFLITSDHYTASNSAGIHIGDDDKKVMEKHGKPKQIINTVQGEMYVYESIIYFIKNNKVVKWATYSSRTFII